MNTTNPTTGVTFAVDPVPLETMSRPTLPYQDGLAFTLGHDDASALEGYSRDTKRLIDPRPYNHSTTAHALVYAIHLAYAGHYPLALSPDMIWLLILQGFARHVNANAESLRSRFVAHAGKVQIEIIRDQFVRGFPGNDWESVFADFSTKIRDHIGDKAHGMIVRDFSTTGMVERAAFQLSLMDAVQSYFGYSVRTRCGIPSVTLEGTPDDWVAVRAGAEGLAAYDLSWWTKHLLPVLDQFVLASDGRADQNFWRHLYKPEGGSGGPYIHGHIVNFFPYLGSYRNRYLGESQSEDMGFSFEGMTTADLPSALSVAPFTWNYFGQQLPMELVAGFIGTAQDTDTLALRPEIGWAVREHRENIA